MKENGTRETEAQKTAAEAGEGKKKSLYARFKDYRASRKAVKQTENAALAAELRADTVPKADVSEFLNSIEAQLGNLDEQNKLLLMHMGTLKENNDMLIEHVKILTKNNDTLQRQFLISKRREKASKIVAIVSSSLAIGLTVYKFLDMFHVFGP